MQEVRPLDIAVSLRNVIYRALAHMATFFFTSVLFII